MSVLESVRRENVQQGMQNIAAYVPGTRLSFDDHNLIILHNLNQLFFELVDGEFYPRRENGVVLGRIRIPSPRVDIISSANIDGCFLFFFGISVAEINLSFSIHDYTCFLLCWRCPLFYTAVAVVDCLQ